ncbi:MAG TPA: hypothetical protein PLA97_13870 [Rubrivivax sp.]|nr:hypothetical protein [Rubrivivax sp.]
MTQSPTDRNRHIKAALAALGASLGVTMVPLAEAGDGSVKPADAAKGKAAATTPSNASKADQKTDATDKDHKKWRVPAVKKAEVDAAKKTSQ